METNHKKTAENRKMRRTSDYEVQRCIEASAGQKLGKSDSFGEFCDLAREVWKNRLPVGWYELRVAYDRPAVIAGLLNPKESRDLIQVLDECDEEPTLVMDCLLHGREALWLVRKLPKNIPVEIEAANWVGKMIHPGLIIGSDPKNQEIYMGTQIKNFFQ